MVAKIYELENHSLWQNAFAIVLMHWVGCSAWRAVKWPVGVPKKPKIVNNFYFYFCKNKK